MDQRSMRKLKNEITSPRPYILWAILAVCALLATYFADPYLFAATTFGLTGITAVMSLMGLSVALLSRTPSSRARVWILVSVTVAAAASIAALALLGSFNWA